MQASGPQQFGEDGVRRLSARLGSRCTSGTEVRWDLLEYVEKQ